MVHPENGISFSTKKKWTIKCEKTRKNLKCTFPSEKKPIQERLHTVKFQLYEFWKEKNFGDSKRINDCQELGRRALNLWSKEGFQGSENTVSGTTMVDTFHYTFLEPREYIILRMNPKINDGLWVKTMWNVGSSSSTI